MTVKKCREVFKTVTVVGNEWMNEESRVVNRIDLKPIAQVWVKFLKSRLMLTTHTTIVSLDRLKGLAIRVRKIIE